MANWAECASCIHLVECKIKADKADRCVNYEPKKEG